MIEHHSGEPYFIQGGRKITFGELYRAHWKMLCAIGFRIIGDREVVRDLVQEVFISFLEKYEQKEVQNVSQFLLQALRNQCFTWLRNQKIADTHLARMQHFLAEAITAPDQLIFLKEEVEVIVATMPPRPQEIFRLSRYDHLPIEDIATRLGLNRRTVENHLTRALKILREGLDTGN